MKNKSQNLLPELTPTQIKSELSSLLRDAHISTTLNCVDFSHSTISLSYSKKSHTFTLFFPAPNNFGQQAFAFPQNFDFPDIITANVRVRLIFEFFQLNNTFLDLTMRQNKKIARKRVLKPRRAKVLKVLGKYSCERKKRSETPLNKKLVFDFSDPFLYQFIRLAATNFDMSFFYPFLDAYKHSFSIYKLSKKQQDLLFKKFSFLVSKLQSDLNLV